MRLDRQMRISITAKMTTWFDRIYAVHFYMQPTSC